MRDISSFPGEDLVRKGLADLARNEETVESLLVSIGSPRLRFNGLDVGPAFPDAEHRLYHLLAARHGDDAHSQYNGLIRLLVSFESALEGGRGWLKWR